jgi:hypothetical protein
MKLIQLVAVLATVGLVPPAATSVSAAEEDGVALAIVYDTSGSMKESVRDGSGKPAPKYVIANRALESIAQRIQAFANSAATSAPRKVQAGLWVFAGNGARQAIPFGPFDAAKFQSWARSFDRPNGGTPLGTAVSTAARAVLNSGLTRKHVLVITDGMSNVGPDPAAVMPGLKRQADQKQTGLSIHFVAFDVDAKVFDRVKKLGATVVGAADETQLNTQLEFILAKKILLEDEEPAKKK